MYCKKCGQEIDKSVKFCPHCGAVVTTEGKKSKKTKAKKPFYKRWWFWVLALFLCSGGCTSQAEPDAAVAEPVSTETTVNAENTETVVLTETTVSPTIETTTAPTIESTVLEVIEEPSTVAQIVEESEYQITYVLNTSSMKFHYSSCSSADDIKAANKGTFTGTRDEVMDKGYKPCGRCHP